MRLTDESKQFLSEITSRFLHAKDIILQDKKKYGPNSVRSFAQSVSLESTHIYALEQEENRFVNLQNCYLLCKVYGISPDWLFFEIGSMELNPEKVDQSTDARLKAIEEKLGIRKPKGKKAGANTSKNKR